MKTVRGVLLDIDGTLVDSNDAHARAWVEAFPEAKSYVRRLASVARESGESGTAAVAWGRGRAFT